MIIKIKRQKEQNIFGLTEGICTFIQYMPTNICLNVVAGKKDEPEAVLIRAVQPVDGI